MFCIGFVHKIGKVDFSKKKLLDGLIKSSLGVLEFNKCRADNWVRCLSVIIEVGVSRFRGFNWGTLISGVLIILQSP